MASRLSAPSTNQKECFIMTNFNEPPSQADTSSRDRATTVKPCA
ncbi:MAG: hypothetical protein ACFE0J_07155 [Elainellaceae cyanobacterium]